MQAWPFLLFSGLTVFCVVPAIAGNFLVITRCPFVSGNYRVNRGG